jgi:hypothetical protein
MELQTIGIDLAETVFHLVGSNLRGEIAVRKKFRVARHPLVICLYPKVESRGSMYNTCCFRGRKGNSRCVSQCLLQLQYSRMVGNSETIVRDHLVAWSTTGEVQRAAELPKTLTTNVGIR